jgi:hypothetical protein
MAKREVYYHIFMRKYKGNSYDELRQQLESGAFCDRDHNDTSMVWLNIKIVIIRTNIITITIIIVITATISSHSDLTINPHLFQKHSILAKETNPQQHLLSCMSRIK